MNNIMCITKRKWRTRRRLNNMFMCAATSEKCPHAGGPLHLGDIEVLPDKSLCVRCPWHK